MGGVAGGGMHLEFMIKTVGDEAQGPRLVQRRYRDFDKLSVLTKCMNETLRMWSVVPYGSQRELEHDALEDDGQHVRVCEAFSAAKRTVR